MLDERRFAPLPRAGITNYGNTCFLSSSVQLLARPLIAARSDTAASTLAARAADIALYAVLGVQCDTAALQSLLTGPFAILGGATDVLVRASGAARQAHIALHAP